MPEDGIGFVAHGRRLGTEEVQVVDGVSGRAGGGGKAPRRDGEGGETGGDDDDGKDPERAQGPPA